MFENKKSYYCGKWKGGCKFQIWKNDPALCGAELAPDMAALLLKKESVSPGDGAVRLDAAGKLTRDAGGTL